MFKPIQFQLLLLLLAIINSACNCIFPQYQTHRDYLVQVHVEDDDFYGKQKTVICTGILGSVNRVITSAKCIRGMGAPSRVRYKVMHGGRVLQQVRRESIHTYYIKDDRELGDNRHGLAVIYINDRVVQRRWLKPVCLPEPVYNLPAIPQKIVMSPFKVAEYYSSWSSQIKETDVRVRFCLNENIKLCYIGPTPREGSPFVGDEHRARHCFARWMAFGLYSSQYDPWSDSDCKKPLNDNEYFIRFDHHNQLSKWLNKHF